MEYLTSLTFIWEFIKPLMGESIKERLKPKGSVAIARKRAFGLYEALQKLNNSIDGFIGTLELYMELATELQAHLSSETPGELPASELTLETALASGDVGHHVQYIIEALLDLDKALKAISPNFQIYQPKLWDMLSVVSVSEAEIADKVIKAFPVLPHSPTPQELSRILHQARDNRKRLRGIIDAYRLFIAKEFSFKETFG